MADKISSPQLAKKTPVKFEDALRRLEEIVDALDSRDVELDKALALFEEGAALVKFCSGKLEETKKKIEILVNKNGALKAVPFPDSKKSDDDEGAADFLEPDDRKGKDE